MRQLPHEGPEEVLHSPPQSFRPMILGASIGAGGPIHHRQGRWVVEIAVHHASSRCQLRRQDLLTKVKVPAHNKALI